MPRIELRTLFILMLFPIFFFLQKTLAFFKLEQFPLVHGLILLSLSLAMAGIAMYARRNVLKRDLKDFLSKPLSNFFIALISALILGLIVSLGRYLLTNNLLTKNLLTADLLEPVELNVYLMLLYSIIPALAPFYEEIIFRHELFYKYKQGRLSGLFLALISSILFGAIHIFNYGGNLLATLPLMFGGLYLCFIYNYSRNIWLPILAHFFYNAFLSIVPALFLLVLHIFS